mgnify:CR=1 FL=1
MKYKKSMYNIFIVTRKNGDALYYNSASGSVSWLNKDIQEAFATNDISQIEGQDYFSALLKNGFVINTEINEYTRYLFKSMEFIMESNSDFVSYTIALTMNCNLKCIYCFESGRNHGSVSADMLDDIYTFITCQIITLKKRRLHITWFGGEPLLTYNLLIRLSTKIVLFCEENHVEYDASIITNGILLSEEKIDELVSIHKIKNIQITLDGDIDFYTKYKKASIAQFNKVIHNIKLLGENNKVNLTLRLNTCEDNKESIINIVEKITANKKFHCYLYAGRMMNYGLNSFEEMEEKNFFEFEKRINHIASKYPEYMSITQKRLHPKGANCGALSCNTCVIDAMGKLYRCEHHINNPEFIIGDVKKGFYRNDIDSCFLFNNYLSKCKECCVFPICMGGCTSDRLIYKKNVNCEVVYNRVINNVKIISNVENL